MGLLWNIVIFLHPAFFAFVDFLTYVKRRFWELVVKETILSDPVIVEMGMKVWTDAKKCIGYHGFLVLFGIVWCMSSFWTCIVYLCALHYNFAGHRRHYYDAFQ